jgi:hypothetical protein
MKAGQDDVKNINRSRNGPAANPAGSPYMGARFRKCIRAAPQTFSKSMGIGKPFQRNATPATDEWRLSGISHNWFRNGSVLRRVDG